jgi:Zn-dependent protease with chaperone function
MISDLRHVVRPYRSTVVAIVAVALVGLWPGLIATVGRVYIALCARYLAGVPVGHHCPPLVVAFVVPIVLTCAGITIVALARQLIGQRQFDRRAAQQPAVPSDAVVDVTRLLGLAGRVCYIADSQVYACCVGLLRPRIFVSHGLLDLLTLDELEAVLRHEALHLARRDPLRFFISDLGRCFAPFFPVVTTLSERVRVNAELDADRASLAALPVTTLANALVKVMRATQMDQASVVVSALSPTDARVRALLGRPVDIPIARRDVLASLGFATCTAIVLSWLAIQPLPLSSVCSNCPLV